MNEFTRTSPDGQRLTPIQAVSVVHAALLRDLDGQPMSDRERQLAMDAVAVLAEAVCR